jgi:hypothetical protein
MEAVYEIASYITVNISSPNTQNLRALQGEDMLRSLLGGLDEARKRLSDRYGVRKPLFLKIAPDLDTADINLIADLLMEFGIDAIIATNTTIARDTVQGMQHCEEAGGFGCELPGALDRDHRGDAQAVDAELGRDPRCGGGRQAPVGPAGGTGCGGGPDRSHVMIDAR